ncbi:MAG: alpha-2-macroglobulin [Treponema sp.]|jgi:uncharacterized protein YfaS (alpha-2-macroglobulin family)|nr:alpha-2-macroglobulin [Treponema sp.]
MPPSSYPVFTKKRVFRLILSAALAFVFVSCEDKQAVGSCGDTLSGGSVTAGDYSSSDTVEFADAVAVKAAFTLDYRPLKPEPEPIMETLAGADSGSSGGGQDVRGPRIIPGLRKLEDYKTVYYDPQREAERIRAIAEAQERAAQTRTGAVTSAASGDPLTVADWGPRGVYSAAIQRPSLYIVFSEPMTPLASLAAPSAASPLVSIEPPLKGSFRWYGTSFLSFEGEEPCQSQQIYTITVSPSAASLTGKRISGERVFRFETETLAMQNIEPGAAYKKETGRRFSDTATPPQAARQISITFNYPVTVEAITPFLAVTVKTDGGAFPQAVALSQETPFRLLAELKEEPPFNAEVTVTLRQGARSANSSLGTKSAQSASFSTPGPFNVRDFRRVPSYGKYRNLVELYFTQPLNEATVFSALSTEPAMVLTGENVEMQGNTARVYNLPVTYGDRFTIRVAATVEDIYGRKLEAPFSAGIRMPDEPKPEGSVRFLNSDGAHELLEAQFAPRYLFEYTNVKEGSWYEISSKNNPYGTGATVLESKRFTIRPGAVNAKCFEEIDLKPFLNPQGKGFVFFEFNTLLSQIRRGEGKEEEGEDRWEQHRVSLQVTDLGVSVRWGFNKVTAMVTSLSTGAPVERAQVRLIRPSYLRDNWEDCALEDIAETDYFGEARTDKNGLAVIPLAAGTLRDVLGRSDRAPFVYVENDGDRGNDRAVFMPNSHNNWAFGVYNRDPRWAEEAAAVTFMFSDRGLYKPGETLTFRGVDRSLVVGMYRIYRGEYAVALEEDRYEGKTIASLDGTVTESGGFHGSFTLPDDLEPGRYRLVYRRSRGSSRITANIPVTVAYFERLKFQAAITSPNLPVYAGEDLNLSLKAGYLSGGSLSGASYEEAWYRELARFRPNTAETRGFSFGPRNAYDAKRHIASNEGALSADGSAGLTQKTIDAPITGAPYTYAVEARVTDISNQMIAAYAAVTVHPARFYIGVAPQRNRGFARLGEECTFNYLAVTPNGQRITGSGNSLFLAAGEDAGKMTVELIREDWRRVQQQGAGGYIYDEYISEKVTDAVQKIPLGAGGITGGSFKVKPSRAGYHILRLSSADREGKQVLTEYGFYVTGGRGGYWNMNDAQELRLAPDQELYNPGDKAQILLQSPLPSGWYLITVEREGIFTEEVRYFEDSTTIFEVPVAQNFVPVVYVSVSSYSVRSGPPTHRYGSPDLDKPKGYFGVTRLLVNKRARAFSVKVESDKKTYRPGEEVTVTLTAERDGRPLPNAELTLMAVDRGVIDLINYHVPDPIAYFYDESRFPLSVYGGDSRAALMDPVTYSVKNLAGGDAQGESKLEERKDFNPTAVFEPMLITGADGKARHTFKLPDNLTTYRVTVFGVRGELFSLKETELAAQNRINIREALPRRLRERDTAEAGVLITNLDSAARRVTVALAVGEPRQEVNNASGKIKRQGAAFVDGPAEHTITVKPGENGVIYFDVAAVKEGTVSLNFTVTSDILNERLVQELIIEKPYVKETVATLGMVTAGSGATEAVAIPSFADNGTGSLTVSLDATRLSLLTEAVDYLFRYPYGCLEQRSSATLPLVIFGEYLDVFGLKHEVADPKAVVAAELKDWARLQRPDGGFPYWPSGVVSDISVSIRIAHIYQLAKTKDIPLPANFNEDALVDYLNGASQRMQNNSQDYPERSYLQAYLLYVLSLLGRPVDASRLAEILRRRDVDPSVLAFAGMAYRNLNRRTEAAATAERLRNLLRPTVRGVELTNPVNVSGYGYYGGIGEQLALTLEFFARQFPGDMINTRLLFSLLEQKRAAGYWSNTAVTMRALFAVDALIRAENVAATDVTGTVTLGGVELLSGAFKGLAAKSVSKGYDFKEAPLAALSRDLMLPLSIARQGAGNLYYTAALTYAIPPELQNFRDEGLGIFVSLSDVATGEPVSGAALVSGKTYRATARLSSGRDRTYVALRIPIPSGAEILDAAFATTASYGERDEGRGSGRAVSHQVILDNEVQYFWDRFPKGEAAVSFLFRTGRRGVYPTPPVQAECMYEPEIFGRGQGLLYTIE